MDASDLLITKPGGMTCTEGQAKGIPMLFYNAIPGQEEKNSQYFVELGLAEMLNPGVVDKWFSMLLSEYAGFGGPQKRKASPDLQQPQHCAATILKMLGKPAAEAVFSEAWSALRPRYGAKKPSMSHLKPLS